MKTQNVMSLFFGVVTFLTLTACSKISASGIPTGPSISAKFTPNFKNTSTGYTIPDGSNATVEFAATAVPQEAVSIQCRMGLKKSIDLTQWFDCKEPVTLTVAEHSPSASQSGTFLAQMRALDAAGNPGPIESQSFYVHPSLNTVKECLDSTPDEEYFRVAGSILNQGSHFGSKTVLEGIEKQIENAAGQVVPVKSLRRSFTLNQDHGLLLVKRVFGSIANSANCSVMVRAIGGHHMSRKTAYRSRKNSLDLDAILSHWNYTSNSRDQDRWSTTNSKSTQMESRSQYDSSGLDPSSILQFQKGFDDSMAKIITKGKLRKSGFYSLRINTQYRAKDICKAAVFNANGESVCIDDHLSAYYMPRMFGLGSLDRVGSVKLKVSSVEEATAAGYDRNLRKVWQATSTDSNNMTVGLFRIAYED